MEINIDAVNRRDIIQAAGLALGGLGISALSLVQAATKSTKPPAAILAINMWQSFCEELSDIAEILKRLNAPTSTLDQLEGIRYLSRLTRGALEMAVVVDYNFQDKHYVQPNDRRYITGDYALLNARLNLTDIPVPVGELRLSLWGKNLTGKDYYIAHGNLFAPGALYGDPRTYGLDLNFSF